MSLQIHDTLKRAKRRFEPREGQPVSLYVCGPTVWNYAHIGNARPVVVFDVLFRLLRRLYGEEGVIYARNFTDVDDKINAKAAAEGVDISVITGRFADIYEADMAALGALPPTHSPRATAHIPQMVDQIEALIQQGVAYAAEGHVLFDTTAYRAYGALSGRSLDDMIAGARVEVAPYKRNPADFVLWKPSKGSEPRWPSPWGEGRPGWHIECSAMAQTVLGLPIDIHGGGHDLIFPHHENEIAQACGAHGSDDPATYARYWMHNGFLDMDGEKMSKSLGNVVLVHDLLKHYPGEVIRWALLSGHYRSPLDWTESLLDQSRKALDRLYGVMQRAGGLADETDTSVTDALADDLNTPRAIAALFELDGAQLKAAGAILGLLQQDPDAWFEGGVTDELRAEVEALIAERITARTARDWAAADRIRDRLTALNIVVMDSPTGATWRMG